MDIRGEAPVNTNQSGWRSGPLLAKGTLEDMVDSFIGPQAPCSAREEVSSKTAGQGPQASDWYLLLSPRKCAWEFGKCEVPRRHPSKL